MSGKSAFVAVVGRPSAGKSTLMNALCGEKVSIVSPVPQTTKNTVRGIISRQEGQLVFLDTPGIHDSDKRLNQRLREIAREALREADLILYVVDSTRAPGLEEKAVADLLRPVASRTLAAVNKTDAVGSDPSRARAFLDDALPGIEAVEISALTGAGTDALLGRLLALAPEGPAWYPEEYCTDQEPVFRIAEIIREKVLLHTREELPHSVFVEYRDSGRRGDGALVYEADLVVERESQKGILIGARGASIRRIREEAERDLAGIFPYPVVLSLKVRVRSDWKKDEGLLKKLFY
ncbi:MAG TPA: GTPase Era [Magnetospirillaceae bacterium]|nr:GTPase Era [Magnetospirillaceae bacterium]